MENIHIQHVLGVKSGEAKHGMCPPNLKVGGLGPTAPPLPTPLYRVTILCLN